MDTIDITILKLREKWSNYNSDVVIPKEMAVELLDIMTGWKYDSDTLRRLIDESN